jgi:para-aminobenzoate synthetase component 1
MLNWANRFNICCFLDNHQYSSQHQAIECLAAAGAVEIFSPKENILAQLNAFNQTHNDWLFGHIGYDLKNETAPLHSQHEDNIGFPELFFFQPETVLQLKNNTLTISSLNEDPAIIFKQITQESSFSFDHEQWRINIQQKISRNDYIATIEKLRNHILRGDCYEINFCQEFFATDVKVDALQVYRQLTEISPNPFSCFYKLDDKYVLCASPERYLQKKGKHLLSQPIKGTFKRDTTDAAADAALKQQLQQSEKDKSENVMVVDLVRNDLSRICEEGSVKVDELFGVYSFPQVHQMISTITGELKEGVTFSEIISATFPWAV